MNCMHVGARGGIQPVAAIEQFMVKAERHQPAYAKAVTLAR